MALEERDVFLNPIVALASQLMQQTIFLEPMSVTTCTLHKLLDERIGNWLANATIT